MFRVLEEGDYDAFQEFEGFRKEAEKQLKTAQAKYDKTVVEFEVEKAAKDARDLAAEVARQTADFEQRSGDRKNQFDEINGRLEEAKNNLQGNLNEIAELERRRDEDNDNVDAELADAEGETQGLRDAVQTIKDEIAPVLLSQGLDEMYAKEGLEYVAFENLRAARENKEAAEGVLEEVAEKEPALEEEYYIALYEKDRATNNEEWNRAAEHFFEVEERYNALMDQKRTAQEAFDALDGDMEGLQEAYDTAKQEREDQAQFLKDEADYDVPEFDPENNGPPSLPTDGEDDAATEGGEGEAAAEGGEGEAAAEGGDEVPVEGGE